MYLNSIEGETVGRSLQTRCSIDQLWEYYNSRCNALEHSADWLVKILSDLTEAWAAFLLSTSTLVAAAPAIAADAASTTLETIPSPSISTSSIPTPSPVTVDSAVNQIIQAVKVLLTNWISFCLWFFGMAGMSSKFTFAGLVSLTPHWNQKWFWA